MVPSDSHMGSIEVGLAQPFVEELEEPSWLARSCNRLLSRTRLGKIAAYRVEKAGSRDVGDGAGREPYL